MWRSTSDTLVTGFIYILIKIVILSGIGGFLWIVIKACTKTAYSRTARRLADSPTVKRTVGEIKMAGQEIREQVRNELELRGMAEKKRTAADIGHKQERVSVEEIARALNRVPTESLNRGGFLSSDDAPDRRRLQLDWELRQFANSIMLLMIWNSPDLSHKAEIAGSYTHRYNQVLRELPSLSLLTLGVQDGETLVSQFKLRTQAYEAAWMKSAKDQGGSVAKVLSVALWELRERGSLDAIDTFLKRYLRQPDVMFSGWFRSRCKAYQLFSSELFVCLVTNMHQALTSTTSKYRIVDLS